jgi:DNA primase
MPAIEFREARARLRLGEVLELLGFEAYRRVGLQVRGRCPLHRSRSPHSAPRSRSFAAHLGKGLWHCFGCGAGGNVLDLWAQATGQNVYQATIDLCQRLGRDVPRLRRTREQEPMMLK